MPNTPFSSLKYEPVRREGLAEKVLHRILGLIHSGNLKAGDRLPSERNLMEIFAVSRPPIREALSALSVLGVVESRHGGGATITDLDAKKLLAPLDFFLS
ncbi:MAG: FadR family transcriptional regulator, partial [Rhizobiales bacterium]|nr:FadR family transcriptional regulator [Hyphomicrobiales bacterium]